MSSFNPNPFQKRSSPHVDWLIKGLVCSLIGLGIVVAPHFMAASGKRDMLAGAWLVGSFSLGLGLLFLGRYLFLRRL